MQSNSLNLFVFGTVALLNRSLDAADLARLESRFLGSGLFEYLLEFPDARYIDKVNPESVIVAIDSFESAGEPQANWTNVANGWKHDQMFWEPMPYRCAFRVQAESDAFRHSVVTIAFSIHYYQWAVSDDTPNSEEAPPKSVLYANLAGLVPCSPTQADGSQPELVSSVQGYPELKADGILIADGKLTGVRFVAGTGIRATIEASDDLRTWVTVGTAVGQSGVTTWMPSGVVEGLGRFFRVAVRP